MRLLFLGLDGATWDVLDPLMEQGHLPTFSRLVAEGCRGRLRSTDPPVTVPAWRSLSSGKHPGKTGVFGWNHPDFRDRRFVFPNSTDYRTRDSWDYLNEGGLSTAVINQPGTAPPRDVQGIFVAGPEGDPRDLVRPVTRADLAKMYKPHSHGIATHVRGGDLPLVHMIVRNGFEVAASLAHEVDVLHHVVFLTDTVQHHLWDDADAMRSVWQDVDHGLKKLLAEAKPDLVLVASDHGFQRLTHLVSVNTALARAGFAHVRPVRGASVAARVGFDRQRVLRAARELKVPESWLAHVPSWVKDRIPEATGGLGTRREAALDWEATIALTGDGRGVYVKDKARVDEVRDALASVSDEGGERFFTAVRRGSDVWSGPFTHLAPDLYIVPRDGVEPGGSVGTELARPAERGKTWVAHHHPEGVFLAWGRGVRAGRVERANIVDVMPTMLAGCGVALPTDIDGTVLDVFTQRPQVRTRAPLFAAGEARPYSAAERAAIEKRLQDLGYLE